MISYRFAPSSILRSFERVTDNSAMTAEPVHHVRCRKCPFSLHMVETRSLNRRSTRTIRHFHIRTVCTPHFINLTVLFKFGIAQYPVIDAHVFDFADKIPIRICLLEMPSSSAEHWRDGADGLIPVAPRRWSCGIEKRLLFALVGINPDLSAAVPTAIMKPLSGSGARGLMIEAMTTHGADSLVGRLCCILQGTTDTTFYVLAVYFGSVGIKNTRHAVACCLIADLIGVIAAFTVANIFFS